MQPAVGSGTTTAAATGRGAVATSPNTNPAAGASPAAAQYHPQSRSHHRRNPSPAIFMNHTPRTIVANTTTIITPSRTATTRSSNAELLHNDGVDDTDAAAGVLPEPQLIEHIHLLEGKSTDPSSTTTTTPAAATRRRKNSPFPSAASNSSSSYDQEDAATGSRDTDSTSRDRSGSGSPCWWSLPDQPFWPDPPHHWAAAAAATADNTRDISARRPPPKPVVRKPLRVDTSFPSPSSPSPADRRPSLPVRGNEPTSSTKRPATRGRRRRFSADAPALLPSSGSSGRRRPGGGGAAAAAVMAGVPRVEAARYTRFDLADFLRNTGPEGQGQRQGQGGKAGATGRKSALRFLGYRRRKSLAERVGTVEGGPGVSQPQPEMFVPAQGVVQTKTKGGTKYLQIVTDQAPVDSQSLANRSLTTSKRQALPLGRCSAAAEADRPSNELLSLKRRSASLPDKLNNHSLGTDQIDTWLSTFGRLQEQPPDLAAAAAAAADDDKPSLPLPLRVTNPSAPSDAQSSISTAAESVRLVPAGEPAREQKIKTGYAVATDAKAALFSNPPSCLPSPTAAVVSAPEDANEDEQRRPATSDTDRAVQVQGDWRRGERPREKTSSERLAGQGINVRRGPSQHSTDEAGGSHNHGRVDSVMTDTSSSSAGSSTGSTDGDELRNGALHLTRRSRDDKIRARKLRDLQRRRKWSGGGAAAVRHGIDEIITQPLSEEEAVPSPSGYTPSGCTPRADGDGRMALTPVVTVAEQMPVPRGRCVRKPARLVLRDGGAEQQHLFHRRRSSAGAPAARRVEAVRTSLSAPPAVVVVVGGGGGGGGGGSSRDDLEPATSRRASSLKFVPGRDEQLRELRAHLHRDQHLLLLHNNNNNDSQAPTTTTTRREQRSRRDAPPSLAPATTVGHQQPPPPPPGCWRDSAATTSSNGFGHYFPHSHSHSHSAASSGTRFSNYTLATPSAMSVVSGGLAAPPPPPLRASIETRSLSSGSNGGRDGVLLEARVEALERQNRLLEAALQAVLKTSGMLNRCPCSSSSATTPSRNGGGHARRESGGSGAEEGQSALDVYLGTRMMVGE